MNRGQVRFEVRERLRKSGIPLAALEADILCSEVFGCSREDLLAHPERQVKPEEVHRLFSLAEARIARVPVAYLKGRASFWGLDLLVGRGCLIPRPETELLVETALELFSKGRFLDWGTGSGCLALALLAEREEAMAVMMEKSPLALAWAWRNLVRFPFQHRALLWHGSSIRQIPSAWLPFDLIVGNPPYIPSSEIPSLMEDVRLYEPILALDGGPDGLQQVRNILREAESALLPGGWLLLEIGGEEQAERLKTVSSPALELAWVKRDWAGKDRIAVWRHR
ncbi:MAG TPA: peptide chain release factor N(5)-glutamine methyltransferase [Synergistales bacterium]|nr:peptide chain release factor N(5)-glutamine methyltransferase [Synergistales bacterium]